MILMNENQKIFLIFGLLTILWLLNIVQLIKEYLENKRGKK